MKLLFTIPTLDIRFEWLENFLMLYKEMLSHKDWDVTIEMPYRKPVQLADTQAVRKAIKEGYDYILRMDDDVWGVAPGAIEELLKADKDMISAVMYAHGFPYQRCAMVKKDKSKSLIDIAKNKEYIELKECSLKGVQPVDLTAFPFTLFKTSLFKALPEPWFEYTEEVPSDSYFCQKMANHGFQPYVHMGIQVDHRGVTHWNRKQRFIADAQFQIATGQLTKDNPIYDICIEVMGLKNKEELCQKEQVEKEQTETGQPHNRLVQLV